MAQILARLGEIEADVHTHSTTVEEPHIGSIKFLLTPDKKGPFPNRASQRPHVTRRIPSFGMGIHVGRRPAPVLGVDSKEAPEPVHVEDPSEDEEDAELEAILAQNGVTLQGPPSDLESAMSWRLTGWMEAYADVVAPNASASSLNETTQPDLSASVESIISHAPLLPAPVPTSDSAISSSHYSSEGSSVMTVRPETQPASENRPHHQREPNAVPTPQSSLDDKVSYFTADAQSQLLPQSDQMDVDTTPGPASIPISNDNPAALIPDPIGNQFTASPNFVISSPAPVDVPLTSETPQSPGISPHLHRFSLVKSGKRSDGISALGAKTNAVVAEQGHSMWSPLDLIFGSGWGICGKCDLCAKRLGWKPVLECDDCGLRCTSQLFLTIMNLTNRYAGYI